MNLIMSFIQALNIFISVFMMLIFIRIVLTYFPGQHYGKVQETLHKIVDPYLNMFRGLPFRFGPVDFTPIFAVSVLVVLLNITSGMLRRGFVTPGLFLSVILLSLWSAISMIIFLFIILMAVRLFLMYSHKDSNPWVFSLDRLITPIVNYVHRHFMPRKAIAYRHVLLITLILLLVISLGGRVIINYFGFLLETHL